MTDELNPVVGDLRPRMAAAVDDALARGLDRDGLVDAVTRAATDGATEWWLSMLGTHLSSLPVVERKAKMFDMLIEFERDR